MIGRIRGSDLRNVCVLAIGAAVFLPVEARADCTAAPAGTNTVSVTCSSGPLVVVPFSTSYLDTIPSDGSGPDTLTITGGQILNTGGSTPQVAPFVFLDASPGFINTLGGNDVVTMSGGTIGAPGDEVSFDLGDGNNTFNMSGGTVNGSFFSGIGADTFIMTGGTITGQVNGTGGGNTYNISGGQILGGLFTGSQNDNVTISGGAFIQANPSFGTDAVDLEDGSDIFVMTGGTLAGSLSGDTGNKQITISGGTIQLFVDGGAGSAEINISGGSIGSDVLGADDGSVINISGGSIAGNVTGGDGGNTITISGGSVAGGVQGGTSDDTLSVSGGTVAASVTGGDGTDQVSVSGGSISGSVSGGTGNDTLSISGGTVSGNVSGDDGTDSVTISGGSVAGSVSGETITLTGGTIGGDFSGITGNTLIINDSLSANPLSLRNGVLFSGTNAVGTITNTDLAQGGTFTQVFSGFASVTADNSTLGFGSGAIGIGVLTLQNGSTLFINGSASSTGTANVIDSTIQMIDGAADDVFTLGGLAISNAQIGLDIDQQTLQADQIVAGAFSAAGVNTIAVNLLGTPQFAQTTVIPIILTGSPVVGNFVISGVPGTPGSLFTYALITGANGNLYLQATPTNFGIVLAPQNAADVATVDTALEALYGINNDAIAYDLGLANGPLPAELTPTVTVFASGQLAHMEHDGFEVSTGGITGIGPGFGVDEFSAAISLDFNAAKAFDLDPQYGLNLGLFGGYASADVDVDGAQGFTHSGDASNKSGMFGGYGLFRQGYNYALVSAIAFIGQTDITNDILGTTGDYDTQGYGITGSVGHIFVLGERLRFDLRGGLLGVTFKGADYTDSGGNQYGESRISFGAVKFEPGIYADYQLENGMVISPYARADIQQRFGYSNEASIDTVEMEFDDADFSAALSGGFNLKMTERATLSSEIRGKWSTDSSTIAGKLGLKIAF